MNFIDLSHSSDFSLIFSWVTTLKCFDIIIIIQFTFFYTIRCTRIGNMLSIALYTVNPKRFGFIQALTGVQMWRCGGSEKVIYLKKKTWFLYNFNQSVFTYTLNWHLIFHNWFYWVAWSLSCLIKDIPLNHNDFFLSFSKTKTFPFPSSSNA